MSKSVSVIAFIRSFNQLLFFGHPQLLKTTCDLILYSAVFTVYQQVYYPEIRRSAHTVLICFVWISEQTAIISVYSINWLVFITETECVYCAVRTGFLYVIQIMCFLWIWEQTAIISLYNINWLVFITETGCVYCAVRTGSFHLIQVFFLLRVKHI
jgi:hypothetical protein